MSAGNSSKMIRNKTVQYWFNLVPPHPKVTPTHPAMTVVVVRPRVEDKQTPAIYTRSSIATETASTQALPPNTTLTHPAPRSLTYTHRGKFCNPKTIWIRNYANSYFSLIKWMSLDWFIATILDSKRAHNWITGLQNVALMKPAWQSSAPSGYDTPERAVDGDTSPKWGNGSCFFTGKHKLVDVNLIRSKVRS